MAPGQRVLHDRLHEFAVGVGKFVRALPTDRAGLHLAGQLLRCGTAPAAHYAEAGDAESWRDYVHKMKMGLKELRETMTWLRCARRNTLGDAECASILTKQCDELIAIHVSCIKTARRNRKNAGQNRYD